MGLLHQYFVFIILVIPIARLKFLKSFHNKFLLRDFTWVPELKLVLLNIIRQPPAIANFCWRTRLTFYIYFNIHVYYNWNLVLELSLFFGRICSKSVYRNRHSAKRRRQADELFIACNSLTVKPICLIYNMIISLE